jgi:hypothetical protein
MVRNVALCQHLPATISASHGENLIRAEGRTKDEAWQNAELQALGLGRLGR